MPSRTTAEPHEPQTMRAWTFSSRGLPTRERLKLSNIPKPTAQSLRSNEIMVKVHYSGIKPLYARGIMQKFPHITSSPWVPEINFSGTVEAIGSLVNATEERFEVGDQVFGSQDPPKHLWYGGTAREYLVVSADIAAKVPMNMDLKQAAALGANACTAVQFLDVLELKTGDKVLVTAASGSLGTMLIPALKATVGHEGTVVGVCSSANVERVKSLGADEVIDYTVTTDLPRYLKEHYNTVPFTAIIDIAGTNESLYTECPAYLGQQGTFLFAGMINTTHKEGSLFTVLAGLLRIKAKLLTPVFLDGVPRKALFVTGKIDRKTLDAVKEQTENGMFSVNVNRVWEMEGLVDAYELMLNDPSGAGRGHHVLHIQG